MKPLRIQSTRDLGPQFTHNPHRMVGQDGAFSIPLTADQSLWFFGDTLIGKRTPNESLWYPGGQSVGHADMSGKHGIDRMINNSALLAHNHVSKSGAIDDFRYLTRPDGQLLTLLPLEGNEHPDWDRIWCQHGIALADKLYLSFIQVRMLDPNPLPLPIGFEIVGSGLAAGSSKDWNFKRITRNNSHILWKANDPHFGVAFLKADDYVYIYGTVSRDAIQRAYVARVRPNDLANLSAYQYLESLSPERWTPDVTRACPLFTGMPSELSVSYNPHLQSYLAVHSLDLTGQVVARTSPTPFGPFSDPATLYTIKPPHLPYKIPYAPLIYAAKEHPQLSPDHGQTLYITYIEFEEYYPHLIEVTLT